MSDFMHPLLAIAAEHGVWLRREAIAFGIDDKAIRRAVRSGAWVRVRHGAYVDGPTWAAASPADRHRLLTLAALRTLTGSVAVSHQSAVVLHGMDLWDVPLSKVHVTRLDAAAGRTERDLVHHEGFCLDTDLRRVGGVPVVSPARAVLETAMLSGIERGLVVADAGLRAGLFTLDELAAQHALMRSWPASRPLQLVTRLADGRSGSVGETRSRYLFHCHHLPAPELQFEVWCDGELIGITDFAWPEHGLLGEFDGKVKYSGRLDPGESGTDALFREKRREDRLREVTGWSMVRLTWGDLGVPRETAGRLRAAMNRAA